MSRLEVAKSLRDAWPYVVCQENENGDSSAWLYKANGKLMLARLDPNIDPAEEEYQDIEIDTPKKLIGVIKQYFETHPLVYVNAYSVSRCYGGPEEGGWWYDDYEPLASVPVLKKNDNVELAKKMLTEALAWENPRGRGSVIGGSDFVILVQDHMAERRGRPRYE